MTATILCWRCGADIHLITEETETSVDVRMVPHTCYRFIVAEHWEGGEVTACWTSEFPGKTGPDDMVVDGRKKADEGWNLPVGGSGWTYRWQVDAANIAIKETLRYRDPEETEQGEYYEGPYADE